MALTLEYGQLVDLTSPSDLKTKSDLIYQPWPSVHYTNCQTVPINNQSSGLVILDVNGLLCEKQPLRFRRKQRRRNNSVNIAFTSKPKNKVTKQGHLILKCYKVCPRPGVNEFLQALQKEYSVAIFSSTTKSNLEPLLNWLLEPKVRDKIVFIWDRTRTRKDPTLNVSNQDHSTLKCLTDIWLDPKINANKQWNSKNTIIVDHDCNKLRYNSSKNNLVWQEWHADPFSNSSDLTELKIQIDRRFRYLQKQNSV